MYDVEDEKCCEMVRRMGMVKQKMEDFDVCMDRV